MIYKKLTVLLVVMLTGCSWPYITYTYGSRYGFSLDSVTYAEYKGFKIADRPDLKSIFVVPPIGMPQIIYSDSPSTFKAITLEYLELDRLCKIVSEEVMMQTNVEYKYECVTR